MTKKQYQELARRIPDWPVDPEKVYGDEFPGWDAFLGNVKSKTQKIKKAKKRKKGK